MTGGILNPAKLPLSLLPAEELFVRCLGEGDLCIIGDGELPKKRIESGKGVNVVRGEVIRFFAYGGNEENPVLGPEIYLQGAWISGGLDLTHASIPYAMHFSNCHFDAVVKMQHAECAGLYLNGSRLEEELSADCLTTKGNVYLRDGFSAEGTVRLLGASIGGDLDCEGGKFHNPGGYALSADGLTTKGNVYLRNGFFAKGEVRLTDASIGRNLDCEGGKFHNADGDALSVSKLTTKGNVYLRDGFSAEGVVRLVGANIGGDLSCIDGKFHNPDGYALLADGLTTKGAVHLRGDFSAEGVVRLVGANIGGDLSCIDGKFHNPDGYALLADGLTTKGAVYLRGDFSAEGEARLVGANIGGDLSCINGKFHNPDGYALLAEGLTTKGDVNLRNGFSAEGEVRLLGASIGGNLNCEGGKFHNPGGYALIADRLTTKNNVHLNRGFFAKGEVRLSGANIGGNLSCRGGEFHNSGGNALLADSLAMKGNVNLRDGFSAKGEVRLLNARIGGDLDCEGGKFHNSDGYALSIERGNISGSLFWRKTTCEGEVNFGYAKVDALADDPDSWESCKVVLDGFVYNRFVGHENIKLHLRWLDNRPDRIRFSPLPYEQAAKVLFAMGRNREAREILLAKERLQTGDKGMPQPQQFLRWLWDVFAGYGYRLSYTAKWMAFFVILGGAFFWSAAHRDQIVPHQPAILASEKYQATLTLKDYTPMKAARAAFRDEYPEFNPLMFSLDVFIPFFALHQEPFWAPASSDNDNFLILLFLLTLFLILLGIVMFFTWLFRHWRRVREDGASAAAAGMAVVSLEIAIAAAAGVAHVLFGAESILWLADWRWLTVWYWFEIAAGWILTSLFLLSATGLLRPRESSGDRD